MLSSVNQTGVMDPTNHLSKLLKSLLLNFTGFGRDSNIRPHLSYASKLTMSAATLSLLTHYNMYLLHKFRTAESPPPLLHSS